MYSREDARIGASAGSATLSGHPASLPGSVTGPMLTLGRGHRRLRRERFLLCARWEERQVRYLIHVSLTPSNVLLDLSSGNSNTYKSRPSEDDRVGKQSESIWYQLRTIQEKRTCKWSGYGVVCWNRFRLYCKHNPGERPVPRDRPIHGIDLRKAEAHQLVRASNAKSQRSNGASRQET